VVACPDGAIACYPGPVRLVQLVGNGVCVVVRTVRHGSYENLRVDGLW
jgi:hypothetical protein